MEPLLQSIKKYLHETLKLDTETRRWKDQSNLPFFLANTYDFYETSLFNQPCLLMIGRENAEMTPERFESISNKFKKIGNGLLFTFNLLSLLTIANV